MSPDEIDDFEEVQKKIIQIFDEFNFGPFECMVVLTLLTCSGYKTLNRSKDSFLNEISKIWDAIQ